MLDLMLDLMLDNAKSAQTQAAKTEFFIFEDCSKWLETMRNIFSKEIGAGSTKNHPKTSFVRRVAAYSFGRSNFGPNVVYYFLVTKIFV